jgi:2-amino-4-hydroxy-6-hydroxymethyldihydropteridine diphosphokinase
MIEAFLGLGSNIGDKAGHLKSAVSLLSQVDGINVSAVSSIYRTEPIGLVDQDAFFNAVVRIETTLEPLALLDQCLEIERSRGRLRLERWGPRTLDIDLLLFGDRQLEEEALTLPHPFAAERAFVLAPLMELWPDAQIGGRQVRDILEEIGLSGIERLIEFEKCETVAIVGASPKPDRYSNRAQAMLMERGYSVVPVSPNGLEVLGVPGYSRLGAFEGEVDTVTLYVGPSRQPEIVEDLLEVAPGRVIFNPGTESPQSENALREAGIETEGACTLVLLQTERF